MSNTPFSVDRDPDDLEPESTTDAVRRAQEATQHGNDVVAREQYLQVPARILVALYEAADAISPLKLDIEQWGRLGRAVGRARVYLPKDHPDHV